MSINYYALDIRKVTHTERIVVLNLLFKPKQYESNDISNIFNWINFFRSHKMRVIATPPIERKEIFEQIGITGENSRESLFISYPVLSFDTCDRWRVGLRKATEFESKYYYLWSADFDFSEKSKSAASDLINYDGDESLVIGTIKATGTKETIDEIATFPLLKLWFPKEYKRIKGEGFTKPRSELLRFSRNFLLKTLEKRWYPTEQTINLILQCFWSGKTDNFRVKPLDFCYDRISDSEVARLSPNVIQQVERMELWLKYIWRDRNKNWEKHNYIELCEKSFEITKKAYEKLLNNI